MSLLKLACRTLPVVAALVLGVSSASAQEKDGVRFRGGIDVAGGGMFVSGFGLGSGGVDGRLGVQINNLIGVYAQPYFTIDGGKLGSTGLATIIGTAGSTVNVDFTFLDQIFVVVGGGGEIFQSVGGGVVNLRVGGYPLWTHGANGVRRKALMLGANVKLHVFGDAAAKYTVLQPMLQIGYEAY
jgi:hypothetical protein